MSATAIRLLVPSLGFFLCGSEVFPVSKWVVLDSAVPLLLVQPLAWGKLDRQPATGYLLGQFTMPWQEEIKMLFFVEFSTGVISKMQQL